MRAEAERTILSNGGRQSERPEVAFMQRMTSKLSVERGQKKVINLSAKVKDMDADMRQARTPPSRVFLSKSQIRVGSRRYCKTRC